MKNFKELQNEKINNNNRNRIWFDVRHQYCKCPKQKNRNDESESHRRQTICRKIESSELENEGGKWIYSFDIRNGKGTITEVNVNAYTGAIVKVEEENKKAEADEKRKEKSEKKTKSGKQ